MAYISLLLGPHLLGMFWSGGAHMLIKVMSVTKRACRCAVGSEPRNLPHLSVQTQPGRQAEETMGAETLELEGTELERRGRRPGWSEGQGRVAEP